MIIISEWNDLKVIPESVRVLALVAGLGLSAFAANATTTPDAASLSTFKSKTVNWAAAPATAPKAKRGGRVSLVLRGTPLDGWHIYGLKQQSGGPIALRVGLDPVDFASADGPPAASAPIKVFEPAFGLETPYYQRDFTVSIPVRVKADAPLGRQLIPVNIRFQACSGGTCEPPKTIHLSAPVQVVTAS